MINRVYHTSALSINPATGSSAAPAEAADSFSAVYTRMQAQRTASSNRIASPFAAQAVETAPSYSSVHAPGVGGAYVQRPVDLDDPEATLKKVEELQKDIQEKGLSSFFDGMDSKESFAYLFERYADAFGAGFLDEQWKQYALGCPPNESDVAKYAVSRLFDLDRARVMRNDFYFHWNRPNTGPKVDRRHEYVEAFSAYFGYGDMTREERYQAILSDYQRAGDFSYAATHKMLWLLEETGAVDANLVRDAQSMLSHKRSREYATLDMTVTDMAKSRFANAFYSYDADAEILRIVDYILEMRKDFQATSPHLTDFGRYSDPELYQFFEKLAADLQALGGAGGIL